jgi:hypothetical protein
MKPPLPILIFLFLFAGACDPKGFPTESDNPELAKMVEKDQEIRSIESDEPLENTDIIHRKRVMELLVEGKIKTEQDKFNAALILQHTALTYCDGKLISLSPENYFLAYSLSKSAFESGYKDAAYLTAATLDRYLLFTAGYQKYGTQKVYDEKTDEMVWAPIDSLTEDKEREKLNVKPLADLLKENKMQQLGSE